MNVLIDSGRQTGHATLSNEAAFREAMEAGDTVFTKLRDVYFAVSLDGDQIKYKALAFKPVGL